MNYFYFKHCNLNIVCKYCTTNTIHSGLDTTFLGGGGLINNVTINNVSFFFTVNTNCLCKDTVINISVQISTQSF